MASPLVAGDFVASLEFTMWVSLIPKTLWKESLNIAKKGQSCFVNTFQESLLTGLRSHGLVVRAVACEATAGFNSSSDQMFFFSSRA